MSGQQAGLERWRARLRRLKLEAIVFMVALFPVIMFGVGFSIYIGQIETSGVLGVAIVMLISSGWAGLALGTMGAYYELRQKLAVGDIGSLPSSKQRRLYVFAIWSFFAVGELLISLVWLYSQGS